MTTTTLLLNLGILSFVLATGLGTRELNRRRYTLPLVLVVVFGVLYLGSTPTSAGDIELIAVLGAVGIILGFVAGVLMKVRRAGDGPLVTVAGTSYAVIWTAVIGGRLLFAYGAEHWFAPQIANFSRSFGINGTSGWVSAFVVMALAMVTTRVAVTAVRSVRATGGVRWTQQRAAIGHHDPDHIHLHQHVS